MAFPKELPKAIWRRAVLPPGLPPGDVAWSLHDALDALAALEGSIVAVLQVDVYVIPYGQHEVVHTGRRAVYLYQPGERASEFAQRTRQSAVEFINEGSLEELFVLLFSGQDDADAGERSVAVRAGQMTSTDSRVTIHMAASLDGFIARRDGRVDWLETSDTFEGGETMAPESVQAFLKTIDCYVMGSRTYETALDFEAKGLGWAYGDKPTFVLTSRQRRKTRSTVEFYSGDLQLLVNQRLRPTFRSIWFVGGGAVSGECLRRGLADEVRYSIMPILIGDGLTFFERLDKDVALHLVEVKAYKSGMVALRYEVRK